MNTKPTVETLKEMATSLRHSADRIDRLATGLEETGEWECAALALTSISNLFMNLRLDLLVTRPVRELERELLLCNNEKA